MAEDNKKTVEFPNGTVGDKLLKEKEEEKYGAEVITLEDCLDAVHKYINGEMTEEQFNDFGAKIKVRAYVPILEKMQLIMLILSNTQVSQNAVSPEIITAELYKNIFYFVTLGTYGQIKLGTKDIQTYNNYDLMFPLFDSFIKQFCQKDFDVFKSMLDDAMNLYEVTNVANMTENINIDELKKAGQENRELIKKLNENKELIADLKTIMEFNDPMTKKVIEELKAYGVEMSNKIDIKNTKDTEKKPEK